MGTGANKARIKSHCIPLFQNERFIMSNDNIQRSKPFMDNYLPEVDETTVDLHHDYRDEVIEDEYDIMEDDGQPSEYDEWQDYMGGDDWAHGQYDDIF